MYLRGLLLRGGSLEKGGEWKGRRRKGRPKGKGRGEKIREGLGPPKNFGVARPL